MKKIDDVKIYSEKDYKEVVKNLDQSHLYIAALVAVAALLLGLVLTKMGYQPITII